METVRKQGDKPLVCTELNKFSYLEKGSGRLILAIKTLPFNVTGVKEQVHSPHWINNNVLQTCKDLSVLPI